jgi:hypothetical protein
MAITEAFPARILCHLFSVRLAESSPQASLEHFTTKRKVLAVRLSRQHLRIAIYYAFTAMIFEWLISSWLRSWVQGEDTRVPFYFAMPIFFAIVLTAVDRWVKTGPLRAVCVGVFAGVISTVIVFEMVRLAVIGADRYVHGWKVLGWYSGMGELAMGSFIFGGWLLGGIGALGRYIQNRRAPRLAGS